MPEKIITLNDYQPENYQAQAVEKIAAELKNFAGGQKEVCISKSAAAQVTHFCEESPVFAEVVYKTKRTLSDCCAEVLKGCGTSISDIDVYRGLVKAYFPNADVEFLMNISINGSAPSEEEMAKEPKKPASKPMAAKTARKTAEPKKPAPPAQPEIIQLSLF
ncbi:Cas9 inhibitor AcrIIA9 family protein [Oscillospiraceae bacterium 42-9]|uniref:Cas9 inhibitor AcrIIA9 family protein n=1 Tax=Acutalibacter sp. 1XD8-36 TaxID=2320852 RepID=UPI00141323F6|nr:Cas9 inhibitor AcrIIA9 family protein [Acutalibacter sp. 1XD8-36]NBJ90154.1 hypothetical protein [Acutalibacter sp. 1XD8-36]